MEQVLIFKLASLAAGALMVVLGYWLYRAGVTAKEGEIGGAYRNVSLNVKDVRPGLLFMLVGGFVILLTVWRGIIVQDHVVKNDGAGGSEERTQVLIGNHK